MTKDSGILQSHTRGRSRHNRPFSAALENSKAKSRQYLTMTGDRKRRDLAEPTSHGTRKSERTSPTSNRDNSARASPGGVAVENIVPRSKAEAEIINGTNNTTRHRQLPCRTFISTGFCPYKEHCVYLHDPRLVSSREISTRTRAKNKEDVVVDSFFWPMLRYNSKTVSHEYDVPAPEDDDYERHDEAVYSLWQHYVDFCLLCTRGPSESASGNKSRFNKAGSCSDIESLAARKAKYSHRSGVRESVEQQI